MSWSDDLVAQIKAQPGYQGAGEVYQDLVQALDEVFINNASAKEQMQQVEDKVKGFLGL